jgi:ferritin
MLSKKMQAALNDQVRAEWESEFIYLAFMAWCFNNNFDGFGLWFLKQADEERGHGMKILRYVNEAGGDIVVPNVSYKTPKLTGVEQIFKLGLEHEEYISGRIDDLVALANGEKDHRSASFLKWFVDEQLEEENTFRGIVAKLERIKNAPGGLYMLESHLAAREK